MTPTPEPNHAPHRARAILRLLLGQAQIIGASASLILLLQQGLTPLVLWVSALSTSLTLASLLLFRLLWPAGKC